MGKGYGRYWLAATGISVPFIGLGVWRIINTAQGLEDDEATQFWSRTLTTVSILVAATLILFAATALPYVLAIRRAQRDQPNATHFLVRRSSDLAKALDRRVGRASSWTYWILTDASDAGFRFRERPNVSDSGLFVGASEIADLELGTSTTNGLPVPALCIHLKGSSSLNVVPSSGPFLYGWSSDRIGQEIARLRSTLGVSTK
jgi:hypothetical protein